MDQAAAPAAVIGRIDALDALRAAVMILGVFLHGAAAYMREPMPGLLWPVTDPSKGWGFDLVLWYLHGFRIPLFFLIAGFFASLLCQAKGAHGFLLHRLRRIGVPLLFAIAIILPATYFIWGLGLVEREMVTWRELLRLSFEDARLKNELLGLGHLWFLQYLLIYSVIYFFLVQWWPKRLSIRISTRLLESWWRLLPWVGISWAFLSVKPEIYTHFDNLWLPTPINLAYYSIFFVVGTFLFPIKEQLSLLVPRYQIYLMGSVLLFGFSFALQRQTELEAASLSGLAWLFPLIVGLYSWLAVWGFLGLFLSWSRYFSPRVRFVSDSAYWTYLIHLPLVGLLQIGIHSLAERFTLSISPFLAFVLSTGTTLMMALISYRYLVRYGLIGRWLNGPRARTMQ